MRDCEWITAGSVVKAHGIRGEMRVQLDVPHDILKKQGQSIRLILRSGASSLTTIQTLRSTHSAALISVVGIGTREAAQQLSGAALQLHKSQIPAPQPGECYVYELAGVTVLDATGTCLGIVRQVVDNGGQGLLVISSPPESGQDKADDEKLLPLVDEYIVKFDRAARTLTVVVPAGLWD